MALLPCVIVRDPDAYEDDPTDPDARFAFDDIQGLPQPKQLQLEEIVRPGHDDQSWRALGIRGRKFVLRTKHYVADRQAGVDALSEYITLVDGNPYAIIQHGQNWGYFNIMEILHSDLKPIGSVIGSLITDPTIKQTVDFLVVSVTAPESP